MSEARRRGHSRGMRSSQRDCAMVGHHHTMAATTYFAIPHSHPVPVYDIDLDPTKTVRIDDRQDIFHQFRLHFSRATLIFPPL